MSRTAVVAWMFSALGWALAFIGPTLTSSPWTWLLLMIGVAIAGAAMFVARRAMRPGAARNEPR